VTGETHESGLQSATHLLQGLVSRNYEGADQLMSALVEVGKSTVADTHPAAFCAVEMANFDMWARETTIEFINRTKPIRLSAIEQPVEKSDLAGLKENTRINEIPIIADESMYTSRGPLYLVENDVCHGLNLRLSSCGGFRKTLAIYCQAKSKGMKIVIGSHVGESAILTYGGRHLAMMCPDVDYMEGSFSKYVLTADLPGDDVSLSDGGKVNVPTQPGLGVDIDASALEMWSDRYAMLGA